MTNKKLLLEYKSFFSYVAQYVKINNQYLMTTNAYHFDSYNDYYYNLQLFAFPEE